MPNAISLYYSLNLLHSTAAIPLHESPRRICLYNSVKLVYLIVKDLGYFLYSYHLLHLLIQFEFFRVNYLIIFWFKFIHWRYFVLIKKKFKKFSWNCVKEFNFLWHKHSRGGEEKNVSTFEPSFVLSVYKMKLPYLLFIMSLWFLMVLWILYAKAFALKKWKKIILIKLTNFFKTL